MTGTAAGSDLEGQLMVLSCAERSRARVEESRERLQ